MMGLRSLPLIFLLFLLLTDFAAGADSASTVSEREDLNFLTRKSQQQLIQRMRKVRETDGEEDDLLPISPASDLAGEHRGLSFYYSGREWGRQADLLLNLSLILIILYLLPSLIKRLSFNPRKSLHLYLILFLALLLTAKFSLASFTKFSLECHNGLYCLKGSRKPFSGTGSIFYRFAENFRGTKRLEKTYLHGKKEGKWSAWSPSGNLREVIHYSDGKKNGKWSYYFANQTKAIEKHYAADQENGTRTYWHSNGRIRKKVTVKEGIKDGSYTGYNSEGNIVLQGNYRNGKKDSCWIKLNKNGALEARSYYKEDQLHGIREEFDSKGKIILLELFCEGKLEKVLSDSSAMREE